MCVCVLISNAAWGQSNLSVGSPRAVPLIWHPRSVTVISDKRYSPHRLRYNKKLPPSVTYFFNLLLLYIHN